MARRPHLPANLIFAGGTGRLLSGLLLAGTLAFVVGCEKQPPAQQEVVRPVKMLTIEGAGAVSQREYPATIKATQQADMGFEVPGRIA